MLLQAWDIILSALPAVKLYFLVVLGFTVVELIFPAERRQPIRDHFSNFQYAVLYLFASPFALIVPTALVVAITQQFGPLGLRLDLEHLRLGISAIDWPVRNLFLPLIPLLIFDFFYYWLASPLATHCPLTLGHPSAASQYGKFECTGGASHPLAGRAHAGPDDDDSHGSAL